VDWGCGVIVIAGAVFLVALFIVALEIRGAIRSNTTILALYLGVTLWVTVGAAAWCKDRYSFPGAMPQILCLAGLYGLNAVAGVVMSRWRFCIPYEIACPGRIVIIMYAAVVGLFVLAIRAFKERGRPPFV
jgi:hypothetical protein